MNIVVCVKYVPDATADRTFDAGDHTVDRASVDGLLSELDEYAVEEALKIRDAGDGEVTVLTVGPEQASQAVRKALQMGADRGVQVLDEAITAPMRSPPRSSWPRLSTGWTTTWWSAGWPRRTDRWAWCRPCSRSDSACRR